MNEVNDSDSGSALESVVQSQQDCDGASNPTVQSTAKRRKKKARGKITMAMLDAEFDNLPAGLSDFLSAFFCDDTKQIEHDAKGDAVD